MKNMAEQPAPQPDKANASPFGGDYDKYNRDTVVGGEAIGVARKIGASVEELRDSPWLAAITNANGKNEKDVPTAERAKNITEIVAAAKAAGVPRDRLKEHLNSLGIATVDLPTDGTPKSGEAQSSAAVDHNISRAYLAELKTQAELALARSLTMDKLRLLAEEALQKGVPRADVLRTLKDAGVGVQDKQAAKPEEATTHIDRSKPITEWQIVDLAKRYGALTKAPIVQSLSPELKARMSKIPWGWMVDAGRRASAVQSQDNFAIVTAFLDDVEAQMRK